MEIVVCLTKKVDVLSTIQISFSVRVCGIERKAEKNWKKDKERNREADALAVVGASRDA